MSQQLKNIKTTCSGIPKGEHAGGQGLKLWGPAKLTPSFREFVQSLEGNIAIVGPSQIYPLAATGI